MSKVSSANGSTSDPREQVCWDLYIESITKGQANAYKAAIKAGYSKDHSRNITLQGWFKERLAKLKRREMLSKAERNLDKILDLPLEDKANIVLDASKYITKTLGKDEGYSDRSELTGRDGESLLLTEEQINTLKEKLLNESKRDTTTRKD
jgi:phage terminase small subunit